MSGESTTAVLVSRGGALASGLASALGPPLRICSPDLLTVSGDLDLNADTDRIVWIHLLPALPSPAEATLGEAELLLASAAASREVAAEAGAELVFVGIVPAQGLYQGRAGLACDLGRSALRGLIENGIAEWSGVGSRIVGVVYGGIEDDASDMRGAAEIRRRIPMGRLGRADELAAAVRYLGSPAAGYVTGTFLHVDGGWRAYSWIYPARTV